MIRSCILEGIYFYTIVIFILDTCLLFLYIFTFVFFSPEWTFHRVKYLNVEWEKTEHTHE
jgi:hypothetical protein